MCLSACEQLITLDEVAQTYPAQRLSSIGFSQVQLPRDQHQSACLDAAKHESPTEGTQRPDIARLQMTFLLLTHIEMQWSDGLAVGTRTVLVDSDP